MMAAYAAVNSLIQTLELFQSTYPTLIHGQTAQLINSLRASAEYFQNILESTSRHQKHEYIMFKDLEGEMRVAVQQAEDLLESNIAEIVRKRQKGKIYWFKWTIEDEAGVLLRGLPQVMDKVNAVRKDLAKVIENSSNATVEERFFETRDSSSPKSDYTALLQEDTVGLDDASTDIIDRLLGSSPEREVITIWGMGGSGKATLAKKVQDDPSVRSRFTIHAWVTISYVYQWREVLLKLVRCITGNEFQEMSDDELMVKSYKALKRRRYLIVVDDVWSTDIWNRMARVLPEDRNGSRIIMTTRIRSVAQFVNPNIHAYQMRELSLEDSWRLLDKKLFGVERNCPAELEEIGREIVGKCRGLPLAILVVAGHLSKVPMTKETWAIVAKNVNRVVTSDPEGRIGLLAMGYHYLPIHLKPCFLHIGTFPIGNEIDAWTLIRLWVAEGFLKSDKSRSPEEVAEECLEDLVSRNLIMVTRKKVDGRIKSCVMHELLQDLSVSEAVKEKLLHVIKNDEVPNFSATNEQSPQNFSLHTSISLERFMKSSQVVRSLYLFKEPTGKISEFKGLRVLAIPKSSFIFRHHMTLHSAILRYLEVTTDNYFTKFLGYMHNLQTFIFHNRNILKVLTLPIQIWNLKQLRHLRVMHNIHIPNPQGNNACDVDLRHLQELSNLCVASCTKEVLSCLMNLKKLRIDDFRRDIKDDEIETSWSLLNLVCLNKLESLYLCFRMRSLSSPLANCCCFPTSLKRLTLFDGHLPCEDLATIAKLPNLEVLKLRNNSFYGEVWKLNDDVQFKQLKFLLLDNVYIKWWEASSVNFPNLQRLVLKLMCHLDKIPLEFAEICTLESIELYFSLNLLKSAREIEEEVVSVAGCDFLHVDIYNDYYELVKERGRKAFASFK